MTNTLVTGYGRAVPALLIPLILIAGFTVPGPASATEPAASSALSEAATDAAVAANPADTLHPVIVKARSAVASVALAAAQERVGVRIDNRYLAVLAGFSAKLTTAQIERLRSSSLVERVEADAATHANTTQPDAPWGLDRVDQRSFAPPNGYSYDTTGAGVTAYVIDTGIRFSHNEFGGRATSGFDFVDGDDDATDCNGHGTHVSGTIGGATYGMAKEVQIVALRVWGCDNAGYFSDMIAAVDWVVTHRTGPSVVNISGGGGAYPLMDEAIENASAAGVPIVVAAGNNSSDACGTFSPAEAPSAITVGAVEFADYRAGYSNYGLCLDLFAPGTGILSSHLGSDTATAYLSGTSMASPHVAGAVARYLQTKPSATPSQIATFLTDQSSKGVVIDSLSTQDDLLYVFPGGTDTTPPTITGTVPAVNSRSVSQAANLTATFSEDVASVNSTSFSLKAGTTTVAAVVSYDTPSRTATLNPTSTLAADTTYTATVTNAVRDAAGNPVASTSWTFKTGPAPTITTNSPAADARSVVQTANVTVTFSEPVTKVSSTTFTLRAGTTAVAAAVSYDATRRIATLNPSATLGADRTYTVAVSGILDAVGNPLVPASWSFKTGPAPTITGQSPASGARAAGTTGNVTVTFSEPATQVSASTFTLQTGTTAVPAAVTYDSTTRVATLNPTATLSSDRSYLVTVSGVLDAVGNPVVPTTWSFITGPAPTISSVSPAAGATSVRRTANATATFSEPIIGASASTVKLANASSGAVITTVSSFSATTKVLTINPSVTLAANTLYRVTITGGTSAVRDAAGNPLATKTWTFRTGSAV